MRIAVLSDTHNLLRPEAAEQLRLCDAVIHAGDVARPETYQELRCAVGEKPFYIVRGNNDRGAWAAELPPDASFTLGGERFYLIHDRREIREVPEDTGIVVYGHTHSFSEETREGRLWLNPGSCGRSRFRQPVTMALLTLEEGRRSVERIDLSGEPVKRRGYRAQHDLAAQNLLPMIEEILERMHRGQSIAHISRKLGLEQEFVAEICRIYVTHPGVTAQGILNKIEVNNVVTKSAE